MVANVNISIDADIQKANANLEKVTKTFSDMASKLESWDNAQKRRASEVAAAEEKKFQRMRAAMAEHQKGVDASLSLQKQKEQALADQATASADARQAKLASLRNGIVATTAVLVGLGMAGQKAWQFIGEGADLELAEMRFERLSTSINTTADALSQDLAKATGGLLSNADQMALAGDLMSLGLAKTHEEAVRLTAVAAKLNMDMNQLVLTLTNQTTMRFDALGIAVDGFDDKVKKLEQSGLSANEAFKMAFIEQAEAQIERVGGVADTTAGQIMMLEASWKNLTDTMKVGVAQAATPALEAINILNAALDAGIITWLEYGAEVSSSIISQEAAANTVKRYSSELEYLNTLTGYANVEARDWDGSQRNLNDTITYAGNVHNFYAERARTSAERNAHFATSMARVNAMTQETTVSLQVAGQAYSNISTNVWSATQAIQDQIDFLAAGGGVLLELAQTAEDALDAGDFEGAQEALDAAALGAIDLDLELGKIDPDQAVERLMELRLGPEEAERKVEELQNSIFALVGQTYTIRFGLDVSGDLPGAASTKTGSAGKDPGIAFASGTNGWVKVPGPVGAPRNITVHGGEPMNVVPAGQSIPGGGGGVSIGNININVMDGTGIYDVIADLQTKTGRDRLSNSAGAGYIQG